MSVIEPRRARPNPEPSERRKDAVDYGGARVHVARLQRRLFSRGFLSPGPFQPSVAVGAVAACAPHDVLAVQYRRRFCLRLDLAVRLLAVEALTGSFGDGLALYEKYRQKRPANGKSLQAFRDLLASIERDGFRADEPVDVTRNGAVTDGAHRLTCAIGLGIEQVPVRLLPRQERLYTVTIDWFHDNGFTRQEITLLLETAERYRVRAHAP